MENCFSSGEGPTSSANTSAMSTSNSSGVALYSGHDGLTFRILSYCTQLTLTIDLSMQVLIKLWENGDLQSMHGFANARRLVSPVLWSRYHRHSQRPTRLAPEMIESFRVIAVNSYRACFHTSYPLSRDSVTVTRGDPLNHCLQSNLPPR